MKYGYPRISRPTQSIDRQIRNITEFDKDVVIFSEAYTGTTQERPQWMKLLKKVKPGDSIVFDSVSRMSRNAEEGFQEYEMLYNQDVNLIFLKEPHINTDVYRNALAQQIAATGDEIADTFIEATNKVLMILARKQIKLAFEQAEKEVEDLHIRTSEGMKTAKLKGKRIGRTAGETVITKKSVEAKQIILRHAKEFGGTLTDKEVMQMIGGISRNSYYKYKKELKAS